MIDDIYTVNFSKYCKAYFILESLLFVFSYPSNLL